MRNSKFIRSLVASTVALSMMGLGASAAHATDEIDPPVAESGVAQDALPGGIAVSELINQGFTIEEVEEAVAQSPYVFIGEGPASTTAPGGKFSTRGVTFGKWIYVRISQAQAKAINSASGVAAAGIIGLATGGVGAVVAGAVYAYIVSIGNAGLSKCARWEFRVNYPLPFQPAAVRAAKCI